MRFFTLIGLFCLLFGVGKGQNQIPNGDFEDWSSDALNLYEEPASGWWTTLNPLRNLGGPVTVSKSTDAHSGTYSARLVSDTYGTLFSPGILLSGSLDLLAAPTFFTRGQPYTSRPSTFEGWYKYSPVDGDSGAIAVQLIKWNTTTNQRDTVGEVGIIIPNATPTWTQFVLPIFYYSNETPDSIIVVATSSADGGNFNGAVGSELWVDDFDLSLATGQAPAEESLEVRFWERGGEWIVDLPTERAQLRVLDFSGKILLTSSLHTGQNNIPLTGWSSGVYLVEMTGVSGRVWRKKVALIR